jgi:Mor family transcriptional regulator
MSNVAYMHPNPDQDTDPDVVAYTLQCVIAMAPGFSAALAKQIEERVKSEFGGRRLFLPKGSKRLTPEQRAEVFKDGITNISDEAIIQKHQISKTTLWRIMKSGGGRFSA